MRAYMAWVGGETISVYIETKKTEATEKHRPKMSPNMFGQFQQGKGATTYWPSRSIRAFFGPPAIQTSGEQLLTR